MLLDTRNVNNYTFHSSAINDENYYSDEINRVFLSAHSFMDFMNNRQMAYIKTNFKDKERFKFTHSSSRSLIIGQLFHSFMESEEAFRKLLEETKGKLAKENGIITKKQRDLEDLFNGECRPSDYAVYSDCEDVWSFVDDQWDDRYERIWKEDPYAKNEVILTGKIEGVDMKGRLDRLELYTNDKDELCARIIDYKTMALSESYGRSLMAKERDGAGSWQSMTAIQEYNYDVQMQIYIELVSQRLKIPKERICVQFRVFVKNGKSQFMNYPYGYFYTEELRYDDEDLNARRFQDVANGEWLTPFEYVCKNIKYAREYLSAEPNNKTILNDMKNSPMFAIFSYQADKNFETNKQQLSVKNLKL